MPSTLTPNMSLIAPTVGQEPGPNWALDLNSDMVILDTHDHSSGKGVLITPSGLSIVSDLTFQDNNATNLRSARFFPQSGPISGPLDLGCLYEAGVDLWYNDGNGNQVRLTQAGSIVGTSGSITGLTPPASASYSAVSDTFTFQSDVNTPANIDGGSLVIRDIVANSKGITLSAPTALSNNYTLTLPGALPSGTAFLTVDNSGVVADTHALPLIGADIAPVTVAYSNMVPSVNALGTIVINTTVTTSAVLSTVTFTSTGRPLIVYLNQPSPTGSASTIAPGAGLSEYSLVYRLDGTSVIAVHEIATGAGGSSYAVPSSIFFAILPGGTLTSGTTHSITFEAAVQTGAPIQFINLQVAVQEL